MSYDHKIYLQQVGLKKEGFSPGKLDGKDGPKTRAAYQLSLKKKFGQEVCNAPSTNLKTPRPKPNYDDKTKIFGKPGDVALTTFTPPYPMEFSWGGKVTKIGCHYLVADPMKAALTEIAAKGKDWIRRHGLHLYAGCFNYRKSRGGRSLSDHAWAIAFDFNPDANGNRQTWRPGTKASNGTYQMPTEAVEIFRKHGFQVGFRRSNGTRRDMMHIAYVDRS